MIIKYLVNKYQNIYNYPELISGRYNSSAEIKEEQNKLYFLILEQHTNTYI